jgi:hypothetical protein
MKLSNSQIYGIVGAVAIIGYFVFRKKPLSVQDIQKDKDAPTPKKPIVGIEVSELKKRGTSELQFTGGFKSPLKEPLYIKPRNLIPNVYDRGIGDEVNFLGNMLEGKATLNISNACKCSDKSKRLPLEIPKIN